MIGRQSAPVFTLVLAVDCRQIQLIAHVRDEPSQMIFRQPVLQARRKKEHLIQVAYPKTFVHSFRLRICARSSSALSRFYLRQTPCVSTSPLSDFTGSL